MSSQGLAILKRPLVTERSTQLQKNGQYVFAVHPEATKNQIREAVETAFRVNVEAVNTANVKGKERRRTGRAGYTSDWKKAIVTLKKGQEIKFAEPQA